MSDSDLIQLYSKRILALAAEIPLTDTIDAPQGAAKKRSPLCGSTVSVALDLTEDGEVSRFSQNVKACALGQASASVLGGAIMGRNRAEVAAGRDALRAMLKAGGEAPGAPFDGLEALSPARDYKNRHASILLAWDATLEAMDAAEALRTG